MKKQNSYLVGTSLFLAISILMFVSGLFVNIFLYSFFKFFIGLNLVVIGLLLTKLLLNSKKLKKSIIRTLFINLFLIVYAFFLGSINGGIGLADFKYYLFLVSSFVLTLAIFSSINENDYFLINKIKNNFSSKPYIPMNYKLFGTFFIFAISLMYFGKAFSFPPPKINFLVEQKAHIIDYSQSTTAFFGLGAIFFTFLACALTNKIRIFILIVALLYLFISFLGGARGELIIALLIINLILFKSLSTGQIILYLIFLSAILAGNLFYEIIDFENYIFTKRFMDIFNNQNFGLRDILLMNGFALLSDRLDCLLIGCGFNFFQIYYDYDFGLYPHNIALELIITYGFLIAIPLILLSVLGCILGYFTKFGNTFTFYVLLYFFGISLKSNSLLSVVAIPTILYFSYISLRSIKVIVNYLLKKKNAKF
jgi:hypothetical protein